MHALLNTLRQMTLPTEACRVFHGRGGLHPGCEAITLDWYAPVWLLTSFAPVAEAELAAFGQALAARWADLAPGQSLNWVFQQRDEMRADNRLMAGAVPEPHVVALDGARLQVHLLRGQNHGVFLDMAEGHRWVREWAAAHPGARVLNLFAYTGAFSVAALRGGAARVDNYDMARGPLALARRNHALNGLDQGAGFLPHDVFTSWGRIVRHGPYNLVVMDPPSHQKGSFVAEKDWARLLRRLPELLAPEGEALLCLNSPKLGEDFLRQTLAEAAPMVEVVSRLPNPAAFADADPQRALKVLHVRRAVSARA
ncbi:MAG: class I SAM-dependent methyltransferase [Burkholderiales bacterium]|nr:class I SAM-dependent methyltransferase [Burkholderiales bacterium]